MPQIQSSTTPPIVLKHRRALEDQLIGQKLDVGSTVMLVFDQKESHKSDARKGAQVCVAAFSTNYTGNGFSECEAVKTSMVGPVPLIKVSQMLGQEEETNLSAGLRTEQKLGSVAQDFIFLMSECLNLSAKQSETRTKERRCLPCRNP